jgi:diketogulonate reductase-like aldo/keto reductase
MAAATPGNTTVALSNGVLLPLVGFGCAGKLGRAPIGQAIAAGYELFDTSQAVEWYTEDELGAAVNESDVPRERLFLTSKLHPRDLGEASTLSAFPSSQRNLRTQYLDAFLLHYPRCFGSLCSGTPKGTWRDSWRALEALYERGAVRAIGVSNFSPEELDELLRFARVAPHLVQSWMDPLSQARALRQRCAKAGVAFQAYSTLGTQWAGRGLRINPVLRHPVLNRIGRELGRTAAQVVLMLTL